MSTLARIVSGSLASWAQIGVTLLSQIVLVPVYLAYWDADIFGVWLVIQAMVGMITTLDLGYHEYIGYEFLKFGEDNLKKLSEYVWASILVSVILNSLLFLVVFVLLYFTNVFSFLLNSDSVQTELMYESVIVFLLQLFNWFIISSISGIFSRSLIPFGYYPRTAWWSFFYALVSSTTPVIVIILGADLLWAGVASTISCLIFCVPLYIDLLRLYRKNGLHFCCPSLRLAYKSFLESLAISGKVVLEIARQHGIRLLISPLAGTQSLTSFATMRTGANVALQGLNTITNPLMPELVRFLHKRDQERIDASFGSLWFTMVTIMIPAVIGIQIFIEPLFLIWTQGKVAFEPLVFALLSISILVYALAQPAISVVRGNNLVTAQLRISAIAVGIVIGGLWMLVPILGILGAAIALLAAEIFATLAYQKTAKNWLQNNQLVWPAKPYNIAIKSTIVAVASLLAIIFVPGSIWIILIISASILSINALNYWKTLPKIATQRVKKVVIKLFGSKNFSQINS